MMWHIAGVWPHLSKGPVLTVPEVVLKRERSGCAVAFLWQGLENIVQRTTHNRCRIVSLQRGG